MFWYCWFVVLDNGSAILILVEQTSPFYVWIPLASLSVFISVPSRCWWSASMPSAVEGSQPDTLRIVKGVVYHKFHWRGSPDNIQLTLSNQVSWKTRGSLTLPTLPWGYRMQWKHICPRWGLCLQDSISIPDPWWLTSTPATTSSVKFSIWSTTYLSVYVRCCNDLPWWVTI